MTEKITIEIDPRDALIRQIESLQSALTKRNKTIQDLKNRLEAGEGSPLVEEARQLGYKRGWIDCAGQLMDATRKSALLLAEVREDAFKEYLNGDKLLVGGKRIGGDL